MIAYRHVWIGLVSLSVGLAAVLAANTPATLAQATRPTATTGRGGPGGGGMWRAPSVADQIERAVSSLTDEQKTKLKDKEAERQQALQEHSQEVADAWNDFRGAPMNADTRAKAAAVMLKFANERDEINAKYDKEMSDILTPEQRAQWETSRLTQQVNNRLSAAKLTDEQKTKVTALVQDAAKEISELKDAKGRDAIIGKLYKKIVSEVLTDEQLGKMMAPPSPGGFGPFGGFGGGPGGAGGQGGFGPGRGGPGGGPGGGGGGQWRRGGGAGGGAGGGGGGGGGRPPRNN